MRIGFGFGFVGKLYSKNENGNLAGEDLASSWKVKRIVGTEKRSGHGFVFSEFSQIENLDTDLHGFPQTFLYIFLQGSEPALETALIEGVLHGE